MPQDTGKPFLRILDTDERGGALWEETGVGGGGHILSSAEAGGFLSCLCLLPGDIYMQR